METVEPIYIEAYESYSEEKCQRLFAEFKRNATWSVPTLVVYRSTAMSSDPNFRNDDRLRYFGGEMRAKLSRNAVMERTNFDLSDFAIERELLSRRKWLVGVLFRAGVPMLAGTDAPNPFCFPGFSLHDELALWVESEVTPSGRVAGDDTKSGFVPWNCRSIRHGPTGQGGRSGAELDRNSSTHLGSSAIPFVPRRGNLA